MSYNKVILLGRLGKDVELRFAANTGKAVCVFSVATSRKWRDNAGQANEETEWHNIVAFDKLAEACGECLKKGSKVFVEGRIKTEKWDDKEGKSRTSFKIYAERVEFLDKREKPQTNEQAATPDEDCPF